MASVARLYAAYHFVDSQDDTITPHKVEYQYFLLFLEDFRKWVVRGNRSRGQGWRGSRESPRAPLIVAPDTVTLVRASAWSSFYVMESTCLGNYLRLHFNNPLVNYRQESILLMFNMKAPLHETLRWPQGPQTHTHTHRNAHPLFISILDQHQGTEINIH